MIAPKAAILALAMTIAAGPPPTPGPPPAPFHIPINATTLAGFPRITIQATDEAGHTNTYTGVSLHDLIVKAGAPTGQPVRGKAMLSYILISASDNYHVLFTLPNSTHHLPTTSP